MTFFIGLFIIVGATLGGFYALGGHLAVLWQPWEFVIVIGTALGSFVIANPIKVIKDTGHAAVDAILDRGPKHRDYLDILGLLHGMMRELRTKPRNEVETHIDNPDDSHIFQAFPKVLANKDLTTFVADYFRLFIIGNVNVSEIEGLMEEEISTIKADKLKPYGAIHAIAEGLPALGIVAAVLGVIKAMAALDQAPELLGALIGAALVGTFMGIFLSYGVVTPLATKIKMLRGKEIYIYVIIKQTLLAFMNGAMPQVAIEHGRKAIPAKERPTIMEVENETLSGGSPGMVEAA